MSCPQCFTGHVNPGTPKGAFKQVFGRRTYVAEPDEGKEAKGIIVIIPDAFGADFVNNQILADHYASAGPFLVYLPDFMDGGYYLSGRCSSNLIVRVNRTGSQHSVHDQYGKAVR